MDVVLLLYIPEFLDTLRPLLDFLLLHFSELVFNFLLFAPLSLFDVINERSFEAELEYLRLSSNYMVEFVEILLDLLPLVLVALVDDVVEVGVFVYLVNNHSSIFDDLRKR